MNSTYEVGSRFTVTVCLQIQEEPLDESTFAGLRILIADDDETVCQSTCERLKELGIAAEWVTNGRAAIEKNRTGAGKWGRILYSYFGL